MLKRFTRISPFPFLLVVFYSQRRSSGAKRLRQRVNERGEKIHKAQELLVKSEISPTECSFMSNFIKMTDDSLSEPGIHLKRRISLANAFQKSISSIQMKANLLTDNTGPKQDSLLVWMHLQPAFSNITNQILNSNRA